MGHEQPWRPRTSRVGIARANTLAATTGVDIGGSVSESLGSFLQTFWRFSSTVSPELFGEIRYFGVTNLDEAVEYTFADRDLVREGVVSIVVVLDDVDAR